MMKLKVFTTLACAAATTGCMTTQPLPHAVSEDTVVHFEGYASAPNALVVLQGYDRSLQQWVPVGGSTFASAGKVTFGGRDLSPWSIDWSLADGIADEGTRECFWDADCDALYGGGMRLRTVEFQGTAPVQFTFRPGGFDCTIQRVIQDFESLETAYLNCHPGGFEQEISVNYIANHA